MDRAFLLSLTVNISYNVEQLFWRQIPILSFTYWLTNVSSNLENETLFPVR